jgi:hypothetical protein
MYFLFRNRYSNYGHGSRGLHLPFECTTIRRQFGFSIQKNYLGLSAFLWTKSDCRGKTKKGTDFELLFNTFQLIKENEIVKAFTKCLFQEHTTRRDHIERYCQLAKIILKIMPKFLEWSMDMFFSVNGPIK